VTTQLQFIIIIIIIIISTGVSEEPVAYVFRAAKRVFWGATTCSLA